MTEHIQIFKTIIGADYVLMQGDNITGYETGWRGDRGYAMCVLRPRTTDDVSKIVSYCVKNNLHLIPQSGNTGMVAGSTPDESGTQIVLNLERINDVHSIDIANGSAHVGAGLRLSALNSALDHDGVYLPIDLGSDPCLGGMVATNTGGSRFLKYRGFRDHIMGLRVVMADCDGTVVNLLKPLHKDNTGFDVKQLFIGTGGIFGVVTEVIVRLSPRPQQVSAALLVPQSPEIIPHIFEYIEKSCANYLSAFEGMSHNAMTRAFHHNPALPSPFGGDDIPHYAILIELSRSWPERAKEQTLDALLEDILTDMWDNHPHLLENAYLGAADKLWALRHGLSEGVQKSGILFAFDISFKRSDLMRFRSIMSKRLCKDYPELTLCDFGHLGDGGIHFALVIDSSDPRAKDARYEATLRQYINDAVVREFNGSYSAEHGLGRKVQAAYDRYTPEEMKHITRAIKDAIAPAPIGTITV